MQLKIREFFNFQIYKKRYKNAHNYDAELNMDFASHRLATFDYLHTVQTVRPDTLANAGLYLSSDGTLSCNFCFDPVNEQALWNGNLASVQQIRDNHVNAMTVKYCKINEPHNGNCDWNLSANRRVNLIVKTIFLDMQPELLS